MGQGLRRGLGMAAANPVNPEPDAAVRTFDLTPMHTPHHYFQFMFLAILKSANFRRPPAGLSEAPPTHTGCPERQGVAA
jgi:hypothetical protein